MNCIPPTDIHYVRPGNTTPWAALERSPDRKSSAAWPERGPGLRHLLALGIAYVIPLCPCTLFYKMGLIQILFVRMEQDCVSVKVLCSWYGHYYTYYGIHTSFIKVKMILLGICPAPDMVLSTLMVYLI